MLERVVRFKDRFYPACAANYELAKSGTMRLMPPDACIPILRNDYEHMKNMIFSTRPEFDAIMACIGQIEKEINNRYT